MEDLLAEGGGGVGVATAEEVSLPGAIDAAAEAGPGEEEEGDVMGCWGPIWKEANSVEVAFLLHLAFTGLPEKSTVLI